MTGYVGIVFRNINGWPVRLSLVKVPLPDVNKKELKRALRFVHLPLRIP